MNFAVALFVFATACYSQTLYRVDDATVARVAAMSPDEVAHTIVDATDVKKNRAVRLRATDVQGRREFRTHRFNPMATAGVVMTWVGTAISAAGTVLFFTTSGDARFAGAVLAGAAEPVMLSGTGLWIGGLARPPDEIRP